MAKQMNPNDLAGMALIHSKVDISKDPIFISYYGKEEWDAIFKFDVSMLEEYFEKLENPTHVGGNSFKDYLIRVQAHTTPDYINKDFDVYPKGLYVDLAVCDKMQSHLVTIGLDEEEELDPHAIGLLVMLSVTSTNGFSIPKELLKRFDVEFLKTCLTMGIEDYKHRYYRHSTKRKIREVREKMREFMGIPAEMMNNKYTT